MLVPRRTSKGGRCSTTVCVNHTITVHPLCQNDNSSPLLSKRRQKHDLRCVSHPASSGAVAACKTRLKFRIKQLNPSLFLIFLSGAAFRAAARDTMYGHLKHSIPPANPFTALWPTSTPLQGHFDPQHSPGVFFHTKTCCEWDKSH